MQISFEIRLVFLFFSFLLIVPCFNWMLYRFSSWVMCNGDGATLSQFSDDGCFFSSSNSVCLRAAVVMIMCAQQLIHSDYIEHRAPVDLLKSCSDPHTTRYNVVYAWCANARARATILRAAFKLILLPVFFIAFLSYPFFFFNFVHSGILFI